MAAHGGKLGAAERRIHDMAVVLTWAVEYLRDHGDDEAKRRCYEMACDRLAAAGYPVDEITAGNGRLASAAVRDGENGRAQGE